MQQDDKEWMEIASVVDSLAYTVKNLSFDTTYRFRVRAENVHGLSEPSESSDDVVLEQPSENGNILFIILDMKILNIINYMSQFFQDLRIFQSNRVVSFVRDSIYSKNSVKVDLVLCIELLIVNLG